MPASTSGYAVFQADPTFDFTSGGNRVRMRMLEMDDLVRLDLVEQLDMLKGTVEEDHIKRVKGSPQDHKKKAQTKAQIAAAEDLATAELLRDKGKFANLSSAIDRVVAEVVLNPVVVAPYRAIVGTDNTTTYELIPYADRDPNTVYTSSVPMAVKMDIFGRAMEGMSDLQPFRQGSEEAVGAVVDEPVLEDPAVSDTANV